MRLLATFFTTTCMLLHCYYPYQYVHTTLSSSRNHLTYTTTSRSSKVYHHLRAEEPQSSIEPESRIARSGVKSEHRKRGLDDLESRAQVSEMLTYHVLVVMSNGTGHFSQRREYIMRRFSDIQPTRRLTATQVLYPGTPSRPPGSADGSRVGGLAKSLGNPEVRVRLSFASVPSDTDPTRLCDIISTDRVKAIVSLTDENDDVEGRISSGPRYNVQRTLEILSSYLNIPMFAYDTVSLYSVRCTCAYMYYYLVILYY